MATFLCYGNFNGKNGDKFSYDILYDILEQNIAENYSKVRFYGYIRSWGYTASGSTSRCYINGQEIGTFTSITANQYSEIGRLDVKVKHNNDGTGSVKVTGLCDTPWTQGDAECSGTLTLPDIPRVSSISAQNGIIGSTTDVTISANSEDFIHYVYLDFGSIIDYEIGTKLKGGNHKLILPTHMYQQIPNDKKGTATLKCDTYLSGKFIGRKTTTITAYANEDECRPLVTATVTEVNKTLDTGYTTQQLTGSANKFIKGVSDATISLSATPRNSATIKSYYVNNDGNVYAEQSHTYYKINNSQFLYTVSDSREIPTHGSVTVDMVNYIPLTAVIHVYRPLPTTGEAKIDIRGNYFNGSFGLENNVLWMVYRFKEKGTSTWSDYISLLSGLSVSGNSYSCSVSLGSGFDYKKEYDFEIGVNDKIMFVGQSLKLTKGLPTFFIGKDRIESNGQQILVPYTLYYNASGSSGTITLSDDVANYKYLEVFYNAGSTKISLPSQWIIMMHDAWVYDKDSTSDGAGGTQTRITRLQLNGTVINVLEYSNYNVQSTGTWSGLYNSIGVFKVVGYR